MKRILTLFITLSLTFTSFAQEKASIFPEEKLAIFLGLDDTSAPPAVKDFRAADLQNITLDLIGSASKRFGYSLKNTTLDRIDRDYPDVTSIYELYASTGTRYMIVTCEDRIYYDNSGTWTDITDATNIARNGNYQFVWTTALDYAVGTNDNDVPIKCTGLATTDLSFTGLTFPVTTAKCVIWWKNYLIWGNITENAVARTTRGRWSNVGTIETYDDDDYIDIAAFGGQEIEGFGLLYDNLYVFLTDSIYKVSLVGGNEIFTISKVTEGIGCIAKNSIQNIQIGNSEGLVFLSRDKKVYYFDGVKVSNISRFISAEMDDLSATRLPYAVSVDDYNNSHYYLATTTGTASANNLLLDFQYEIGEWSKHTQIDANAIGMANDANEVPQVYFGNYDSFVYQMNDPDLNSDVDGVVGVFDGRGLVTDTTATGVIFLYDTSVDFSTCTGAIVTITGGTGSGEESVILSTYDTTTGIVVTDGSMTATGLSVYSIGAIDSYYTTKWYDLGIAPQRKNFGELFLWATTDTSTTMQLYHGTDFANTITTADIDLATDSALWGTAIWGTSTWGGVSTSLTRVPLNTSGRFIKYKFSENTIDEPMVLYGYSTIYWGLDAF